MSEQTTSTSTTRYKVEYDTEAVFEECNGERRPLTEHEYAVNQVMEDGQPVPYKRYLRYWGNPERHVYLGVIRQDRCSCCGSWVSGGSLWNIDTMDDQPESGQIGTFTLEQLVGYLKDVAGELEPAELKEAARG